MMHHQKYHQFFKIKDYITLINDVIVQVIILN